MEVPENSNSSLTVARSGDIVLPGICLLLHYMSYVSLCVYISYVINKFIFINNKFIFINNLQATKIRQEKYFQKLRLHREKVRYSLFVDIFFCSDTS